MLIFNNCSRKTKGNDKNKSPTAKFNSHQVKCFARQRNEIYSKLYPPKCGDTLLCSRTSKAPVP